MDSNQTEKTCGIIMICGYLGSGKTTLIQHILKNQSKYKIAVIQNEFSDEMGIESPLMQMADGKIFDKFYELPNGCVCCSAKEDLHRAIEFLVESEKYNLDYILVETNGLADPSSAIKTFWLGEEMLKVSADLRKIYAIVAAHTFEKNINENEIYLRQLIFADLILINHTDRVEEKEIENIEEKLKKINPNVVLKRTKYCEINLDDLFDKTSFNDIGKDRSDLVSVFTEDFEHLHAHKKFQFLVYEFDGAFDIAKLDRVFGVLLWDKPDGMDIIRCKGIIHGDKSDLKFSLQGVSDIYEIKENEIKWEEEGLRKSKMLFIGVGLDKEKIRNMIEDALIKDE